MLFEAAWRLPHKSYREMDITLQEWGVSQANVPR